MRIQPIFLLCIFLLQSEMTQLVQFNDDEAVDLLLLIDFRYSQPHKPSTSSEQVCLFVKDTFNAAEGSSLRVALAYLGSSFYQPSHQWYTHHVPIVSFKHTPTPDEVKQNCSAYLAQYAYVAVPFETIYKTARTMTFSKELGDRPAPDVIIYVFYMPSGQRHDFKNRMEEVVKAGIDLAIGMQDYGYDNKISYMGMAGGNITEQKGPAPVVFNAHLKVVKDLISQCPHSTDTVTTSPCHYRPNPADSEQLECIRRKASKNTKKSKYCWEDFVEFEKCDGPEADPEQACKMHCDKMNHVELWPCNATCAQDGVSVMAIENTADPYYVHCPPVSVKCEASPCNRTSTAPHTVMTGTSATSRAKPPTPTGGKQTNHKLLYISIGVGSALLLVIVVVVVVYCWLTKKKGKRGQGSRTGSSNVQQSRTRGSARSTRSGQSRASFTSGRKPTQLTSRTQGTATDRSQLTSINRRTQGTVASVSRGRSLPQSRQTRGRTGRSQNRPSQHVRSYGRNVRSQSRGRSNVRPHGRSVSGHSAHGRR